LALERFTAEFGMGSGVGTPHLSHQTGGRQICTWTGLCADPGFHWFDQV
jgi:hypothetical protein